MGRTIEWEIPIVILKSYLIEEIEDMNGESKIIIDDDISYYNRNNLNELLDYIDKLDIKEIHINENCKAIIELLDNSIMYCIF